MTIDKDLNPMNVIKPLNINPKILYEPQPFTTFEIGKLWATYMGNSMSIQILSYFLQIAMMKILDAIRKWFSFSK